MFKSSIPSIMNKSRTLIARRFGSETQRILADMLYNDDVNVLTTFDMNRVASYTFGDSVCGEIYDVLEYTLRNPLEFTVLSLHKTMVLMHHLCVYASQKAANNTWILKPHIKPLMEYNTVLAAMAEPKSLLAKIQRIKGGSVDRGLPVREATKVLWELLSDVEMFKKIRTASADPDSLVPVGHHEQVGFVSDEVRKATLEEKLQKKNEVQIKSTLKDGGAGGFGSGSTTVIGAAHSMEEMLKMAERNKGGYRDNDPSEEDKEHEQHLYALKEELKLKKVQGVGENGSAPPVVDLLDFASVEPEVQEAPSFDGLPYEVSNEDSFILTESPDKDNRATDGEDTFGSSSSLPAVNNDPFASLPNATTTTTPLKASIFSMGKESKSGAPPPQAPAEVPAPVPTAKSNSDEMDLLSLTMGAMGVKNPTPTKSVFDNAGATLAFGSLPSPSSDLMGGSPLSNTVSNVGGSFSMNSTLPNMPSTMPPPPTTTFDGLPTPPSAKPPSPPTEKGLPAPMGGSVGSFNMSNDFIKDEGLPAPMGGQAIPASMGGPVGGLNMTNISNNNKMPMLNKSDGQGLSAPMGGTVGSLNMNNSTKNNNLSMENPTMNNLMMQNMTQNMMQNNRNIQNMTNNNNNNNNNNMQMMNNPMMINNPMMNNSMMMNNPMMMQNAMQNSNQEQQAQLLQQMMMMNQQMMAQLMQAQNQQSSQSQAQNSTNSNGSNNNGNGMAFGMGQGNQYSAGMNPFSG